MMKSKSTKFALGGLFMCSLLTLATCQSTEKEIVITGELIPIDSIWDKGADEEAIATLKPYQARMDSVMNWVMGTSEMDMESGRPESLLSNLVADVLKQAGEKLLNGKAADMGLVNMGGLRNVITKGPVTCGNIYEVLPFENSLSVLTLKGTTLKMLFEDIARRGGEGVSGVALQISRDGKLLNATIGGKPVVDDQLYTVATIDYLAEGNDGMISLIQAEKRENAPLWTLRRLFMDYVMKQTTQRKALTSKLENRIVVMGMGNEEPTRIHILQTSDTHSRIEPIETNKADRDAGKGGVVRRASFVKQFKNEFPETLVVDCGDFCQGTPYYNFFFGDVEVEMMNQIGYDAITIGNHEFDFGMENLARLYQKANFPVVCANYDVTGTELEGLVKPYTIVERSGLKIGLFGLSPKLEGLVQADKCEGITFLDPIKSAKKVIEQLREKEKCDLVVCLSHLGIEIQGISDEEVIASTSGIDLLLGGHTHTLMNEPRIYLNENGKDVPAMHTGRNGAHIGKIEITIN